MKNKRTYKNNSKFIDSVILNDETFLDYLNRFQKIALSMFEWINLPDSMNSRYLELCLYMTGMAGLLYDDNFGFINTKATSAGEINIYGLPSKINCYSYGYQTTRKLYTGLKNNKSIEDQLTNDCILVGNNFLFEPTLSTMQLFAYRLYEAESTAFVNIIAQKTPVMLIVDEKQRLTMENLYSQYQGNRPFIFGDSKHLSGEELRAIKTDAPFVADKIMEYKKEIWNEALTYLGINNIMVDKKERLVSDEANSNNELINLNLQSYLIPRKEACKQFNEKFGLTGTDKQISVRIRSDLHNIIKNEESIVLDYTNSNKSEV